MATVDPLRTGVGEQPQAGAAARELIAFGIRTGWPRRDICVVSLAGEHDLHTAPKAQQELRRVIAAGARTVVVDLTETTFLDSTVLSLLLVTRKELRAGGRLLLVTDEPRVKRVFEIAGVDRLFDFFPSRRAAEEESRSS